MQCGELGGRGQEKASEAAGAFIEAYHSLFARSYDFDANEWVDDCTLLDVSAAGGLDEATKQMIQRQRLTELRSMWKEDEKWLLELQKTIGVFQEAVDDEFDSEHPRGAALITKMVRQYVHEGPKWSWGWFVGGSIHLVVHCLLCSEQTLSGKVTKYEPKTGQYSVRWLSGREKDKVATMKWFNLRYALLDVPLSNNSWDCLVDHGNPLSCTPGHDLENKL